jgi:ABC-2 type transport system permease protein
MLMLRHRPDFDPMYVVVGAGLSGLWSTILFAGSGAITHERWMGTLELLVASPTSLVLIFGGKLLGTLAFSLVSLVLSYGVGAWLFGYSLVIADPGGLAISLLFALAALWVMGMLFAPLAIYWRPVGQFLGVLEYPIFSLSGFLFPILLLPGWTVPVSDVLPPYWAAVAMHGAARGDLDLAGQARAWLNIVVLSAVLLMVSLAMFRAVLVRARRAGTLALT